MLKKMHLFWIVLATLALSGCSYLPPPEDLISFLPYVDLSGPGVTTIKIHTTKSTNDGAPFYLLVKGTPFQTFVTEDYRKITSLVMHPDPDQACFAILCIIPGNNEVIKVETPEDQSIALYCLFTHPGKIWKQIFELNNSTQTIKVELGENEIVSVNVL